MDARAERRVRRRRAARAHRLPQLRQPRARRDRVGARPGDRGHRAGRRGARHPGRLRERLALQRDRRPADPADAGRRLRRARPRRDADPVALAPRRPRLAPSRRGRRARPLRLAERAPLLARPRRLRRRPRARAPRGGAWSGVPRPDDADDGRRDRRRRARRDARLADVPPWERLMRTLSSGHVPSGCPFREPTSHPVGVEPTARSGPASAVRADCASSTGADRLMCGVFGIHAPDRDVARLTYFGLHALQHRGQESAGIAVSEHGRLTALRDLGLVTQVFDEQQPLGPPRRARDRPHALLDDRLERVGERAAAAPPRPRAHRRARAQRQPDQRRRAARRARRRRLGVDLRQRDGRGADRERRAPARARRSRRRWGSSRALRPSSASPTGSCSRSATATASGRSCSGGSATTPSSRPRPARST